MVKINNQVMNTGKLHDRHVGGTIVLVGNAASLNDVDLSKIGSIPTIGCNRILRHPTFRPTYLMVADRRPYASEMTDGTYRRHARTTKMLFSTTIYDPKISCYDTPAEPLPTFPWYPWRVGVSSTPANWTTFRRPLCSFASITGPMLQAAVIMGATKIGIVGVDMQAPDSGDSIHFYKNEGAWEGYKTLPGVRPGGSIIADKTLSLYKQAVAWLFSHGVVVANLNPRPNTVFSRAFGRTDFEEFCSANQPQA
uniref:Uncharacterized protein n=1 Tax=viral metagenome TaxID=1070528 RepID=A0A6M3INL3_9ZZZZ